MGSGIENAGAAIPRLLSAADITERIHEHRLICREPAAHMDNGAVPSLPPLTESGVSGAFKCT
jgi:hypothetical protein